MKLTALLLTVACLQLSATGYSQNISLSGTDIPLDKVFSSIEKQSGYFFFYKYKEIEQATPVSLNLKNIPFKQALELTFQNLPFTYSIEDKTIIVSRKPGSTLAKDESLTIRGRVFDTYEPPVPIPGVSIIIKGKNTGTTTDNDGYFTIKAEKGDVLVFSMISYKKREYTVTRSEKSLTISLENDVAALEQVVVTGMSEQQVKHIASSIATLNVKSNIEGKPITSLSQALQGGVTGINVNQGSGLPGGDAAAIKIRGITTLNNSDALVLVDGVPMDMNYLDPVTIESVTVLKDAAAAAIYGARAANGVILVTTKRGVPGKVSVTYDAYAGVQSPNQIPDFVDAPTYMRMYNVAMVNSGGQPFYSEDDIQKTLSGEDPINYPNTDWADLVISKYSPITSHSLSVSGGNELARFAITGNYLYQDGMIPVNHANRYTLRANTSISLSKKFLVYLDALTIKRNTLYPNRPLDNGGSRILDDMYRLPPTVLPKYPDVEGYPTMYGRYADIVNPVAYAERGGSIKYEFAQTNINLQPKWEVFPGFNLKGQFSFRLNSDVYKAQRDNYYFFDYYTNQLVQTWAVQRDAYSQTRDTYYYLAGSADYTLRANKHQVFAIGGYSMEQYNNGYYDISSLLSGFAKVNYSYDDKYLLEGSIRVDGSSKFGPGNKFGYFPSVALGWNLHNETFLKNSSLIKNLKLRASYGQLGNESIGLYQYQNLISATDGTETSWGNPNITWEKVNMFDVGTDISLFPDKSLSFTVDYYNKVTKDIILKPVVSLVGAVGKSPLNAGSVRNTGLEATFTYTPSLGKNLSLTFKPGVTYNKNKIISLPGGDLINAVTIQREGYALGSYFGYKTNGLLQASDFNADGTPKIPVVVTDAAPGDVKYLDLNHDGSITDADREVIGDPTPKLNYFADVSFSWKKFDLEFLVQGVGKYDYSANIAGKSSGYLWNPLNFDYSGGVPTNYRAANTWRPNNTDALFPRLLANPNRNTLYSDFWLFNGAYTRMKFIQLGYRLDSKRLKLLGITSLRFYVNAQNPFVLTSLKQTDPESGGGSWTYGIMKTYTFGVHVGI
ncbi:TonB-dependent receptor (plasmid) [Pedobacter sp. BS3]|uniref:TonB-dependent receptor n=1 Tax=Pedobacter sp. BS3 TaxID=2567937 RepID=UPI0011F0952D|nr:TonB-dependent receptor [Pedobacter sp. BS3]TZF86300.1 TonB-dependent receptor [Pedobacter sp. BS3]